MLAEFKEHQLKTEEGLQLLDLGDLAKILNIIINPLRGKDQNPKMVMEMREDIGMICIVCVQ